MRIRFLSFVGLFGRNRSISDSYMRLLFGLLCLSELV
jgi:hypothetical protein